ETYLRDGAFDKDSMLEAVTATIEGGRDAGFPRSRIVGQMGWAVREGPAWSQVLEYEVEVNDVLARSKHPAICVYYVDELSAGMMMDLLRVHPACIVDGVLYENPFYTPAPEMLQALRER